VIRTRVGYAGGTTQNPAYYNLDGHAETVQIEYDPTVISYDELLNIFWEEHNPVYESYPDQYRSIIFYHNEEQKRLALEAKQRQQEKQDTKIYTEIIPFSAFYLAEDYHQKYYLRLFPEILIEYERIYPDLNDLINSTAVTRVNGYLGGYGAIEDLEKNLNSLGLSTSSTEYLLEFGRKALSSDSKGAVCPIPE
jgi:peptide-methionine (S)-S-oxide reductase